MNKPHLHTAKRNKLLYLKTNGVSLDRGILNKRFSPCDLRACKHACCRYGAVVGEGMIRRIGRLLPRLLPLMRPEAAAAVSRRGFFRPSVFTRSDMDPGHDHHYLRTVRGRCVFLTYDDAGGCVLQKYAHLNKMRSRLKPVGCWAFPFDLVGKRLIMYRWQGLPCLDQARNAAAPSIISTCEQELTGLIGRAAYRELTSCKTTVERYRGRHAEK